ncbi:LysR family transcriptional regulator [Acinetobacter sp. MB5]|uniref:LysR family transcriptional regulator n=1 Tax=Acinetobacter sp. MB5 TaxID=2069438 RepID=UPI0013A6A45F|nr:LysR family transcriptional regulator [Acinetobacter sp. MB5]
MNWNDLQIFLNIYRYKTLRAAAKELAVDQATIGRRLNELEQQLNTKLFIRSKNGAIATPEALKLIPYVIEIEKQMLSLARQVKDDHQEISGIVKISTTDSLAVEFIIPVIDRLKQLYPLLNIHLITSIDILDLDKAEADISIRTIRPTQPDLIVRKLADWEVGLYASEKYVLNYGIPTKNFDQHKFVIYQKDVLKTDSQMAVGELLSPELIVAEVNSSLMLTSIIQSGSAMGEVAEYFAQKAQFIRVFPDKKRTQNYQVWLTMHKDVYKTQKIRVVVDQIVKAFECKISIQ